MESCAHVLPVELRDRIQCRALATEADGPGACISRPGIVICYFCVRPNILAWLHLFMQPKSMSDFSLRLCHGNEKLGPRETSL